MCHLNIGSVLKIYRILLLYFAKGLIDIVQKRMGQYKINALLQKWFTTGLMTTGLNMSTLLQR